MLPVDCKFSRKQILERIKQGIAPESGAEYLARGKIESEALLNRKRKRISNAEVEPRVVEILKRRKIASLTRAKKFTVDSTSLLEKFAIANVLMEFKASRAYIEKCIEHRDVQKLRTFPIIPKRSEIQLWAYFMFGTGLATEEELIALQSKRKKKVLLDSQGVRPTVNVLIHIDYGTICTLLSYIVFSRELYSQRALYWLYGLLSRICLPLDGDTEAAMNAFNKRTRPNCSFGRVLSVIIKNYFKVD